ncbi:MAG: GFA family protein [Steroidobacteraceae bacterium]
MSAWRGSCHCGAVGFEYRTGKPPDEWSVRACQCSFCRRHGAAYTSDPAGSVRFAHADASALSRYRFGQHTADFIFCGRCGGYLGAATDEEGQSLMVVNLRALDPGPDGLPAAQPMSYEGESKSDRDSRRASRWTPVQGD